MESAPLQSVVKQNITFQLGKDWYCTETVTASLKGLDGNAEEHAGAQHNDSADHQEISSASDSLASASRSWLKSEHLFTRRRPPAKQSSSTPWLPNSLAVG